MCLKQRWYFTAKIEHIHNDAFWIVAILQLLIDELLKIHIFNSVI